MDLAVILDIVALGYGSFAAPMWNNVLKSWKFAKDKPNDYGSLKDFTNSLTQNGLTLTKDLTRSSTSLGAQNQVTERLRDMILIWQNSVVGLAEKLFSGKDEDTELLGKVIVNGKMVASNTDVPSVEDLRQKLERSIYATLIPLAWDISAKDISPL